MLKRPFDTSRVINGTIWMLGRDWRAIVLLLILWTVSDFALYSIDYQMSLNGVSRWFSWTYLTQPFFAGAATALALSNNQLNAFSALGLAGRRYLTLLFCAFLVMLGTMVGFLLLVIPGLVLLVLWNVAIPILIAENRPARRSMRDSMLRVKPYFWHVAGLIILWLVASIILDWIFINLDLYTYAGEPSFHLVFEAFVMTVLLLAGAYMSAAIYNEIQHQDVPDVNVFD